jgi:glutaredoxin
MIVTWPLFTWKGIVVIVPFWTIFETVYRARTRAALACPHCGFDPYLFARDIKLAAQEVDTHWRRKFAEKGVPYPERVTPAATQLGLRSPEATPPPESS